MPKGAKKVPKSFQKRAESAKKMQNMQKKHTQKKQKNKVLTVWLQMAPNCSKSVQVGPNVSDQVQSGPNWPKWIEIGSIVCKWYNFGANWFGWVEMGPKKDQIGPKYPRQFKIGQKGQTRPKMVKYCSNC